MPFITNIKTDFYKSRNTHAQESCILNVTTEPKPKLGAFGPSNKNDV